MFCRRYIQLARFTFFYRQIACEPHHERKDTGGEDAYLSMDCVQAVLDGVGWWRHNTDVSAGLFSGAFAKNMYDYVQEEYLGETPHSSYELLRAGYEQSMLTGIQGTTTTLVATLQAYSPKAHGEMNYRIISYEDERRKRESSDDSGDDDGEDGECTPSDVAESSSSAPRQQHPLPIPEEVEGKYFLDVANVGDCTLVLIRRGVVLFISKEQQHDIDYPFQLGSGSNDTPESSDRYLLPVEKGDIVAMGSDGIFDNIYAHHLAEYLWSPISRVYHDFSFLKDTSSPEQPQRADYNTRERFAAALMEAIQEGKAVALRSAVEVSRDVHCDSPYASKCIERGALYEGGKPDDMTLLISIVDVDDETESGERVPLYLDGFPPPYRDWP